jgi:hypothetical protein
LAAGWSFFEALRHHFRSTGIKQPINPAMGSLASATSLDSTLFFGARSPKRIEPLQDVDKVVHFFGIGPSFPWLV